MLIACTCKCNIRERGYSLYRKCTSRFRSNKGRHQLYQCPCNIYTDGWFEGIWSSHPLFWPESSGNFRISGFYVSDPETLCFCSQFSWVNDLPIYTAVKSELNEVNDRPSSWSCRWNRSCRCYTSKEASADFFYQGYLFAFLFFYYWKVAVLGSGTVVYTFIGSTILIC